MQVGSHQRHRLAAILASDVVGYSRSINADEASTLSALTQIRHLMNDQIQTHGGRIANTAGDSVIAEFGSAVNAVSCGLVLQELLTQRMASLYNLQVRMGIHVGDVVSSNGDILGNAVNIAARLESIAQPGGIVVSAAVRDNIAGKLPTVLTDLGLKSLKNIVEPVRAFSVASGVGATPAAIRSADQQNELPHDARISIAVLPFVNLSSDQDQEFLADGITEDLITELSRVKDFLVIARNTVFGYKGRAIDVTQVERELGVDYLIEGSVRQLGTKVRITAQLIETHSASHLWAEKFDCDMTNLLEIQDQTVRAVAASTYTKLLISAGAVSERLDKEDVATWALWKRGMRELYSLTSEGLEQAELIGRELLRREPSSAKARLIIALALYHYITMGYKPHTKEIREETLRFAREAAQEDSNDEFAVCVYGFVLNDLLNRHQEAIIQYEQALRINPNFSIAYGSLGTAYMCVGRLDEAIRQTEIAIRLNPRDPSVFFRYVTLAEINLCKGNLDEALHWARQAIGLRPSYFYSHALAAAILGLLGDQDAAQLAAANLRMVVPDMTKEKIRESYSLTGSLWVELSKGLAIVGIQ
jgi:adenylate cyclase